MDNLIINDYNDPILRKVCKPITEFSLDLQTTLDLMISTMYNNNGVGLAANQVGYEDRFIVVMDPNTKQVWSMVNPEVTWTSFEKDLFEEGCLSVKDENNNLIFKNIERPRRINVKWQKADTGEVFEHRFTGLISRIIQHEIDHLDGILFTDYIKDNNNE